MKRTKKEVYSEMMLGNSYSDEEAIMMRDHFKLVADSCHELGLDFSWHSEKQMNSTIGLWMFAKFVELEGWPKLEGEIK